MRTKQASGLSDMSPRQCTRSGLSQRTVLATCRLARVSCPLKVMARIQTTYYIIAFCFLCLENECVYIQSIAEHIPKVDHSKGVYMHDHPDFPSVHGGL